MPAIRCDESASGPSIPISRPTIGLSPRKLHAPASLGRYLTAGCCFLAVAELLNYCGFAETGTGADLADEGGGVGEVATKGLGRSSGETSSK